MDQIRLCGLRLFCKLGANEWERFVKREVVVDVTLYADLRAAAISDRITDTVNYAAVAKAIARFVENSDFKLIESLADGICGVCLGFPHVRRVDVDVEKVHAVALAECVAVRLTREKRGAL